MTKQQTKQPTRAVMKPGAVFGNQGNGYLNPNARTIARSVGMKPLSRRLLQVRSRPRSFENLALAGSQTACSARAWVTQPTAAGNRSLVVGS